MKRTATTAQVGGVKRYRAKGNWFCYHRASGKRLIEPFGTAAFFAELALVEQAWSGDRPKEAPGTLGMLIALYKAAPAFTDLAPRTQSDYDKLFDYLKPLSGMPLATIDSAWIARLRDKTYKKKKRRFANYVVSVLGSVFAFGKEYGHAKENPAKGVKPVKRPRGMAKANRPWTQKERDIVLEHAPGYLKPPIALGMFAGMREGDTIALPRNARGKDGWLTWRTGKGGIEAEWPVHPRLAQILDKYPSDAITMCVTSKGKPWKSVASFRSQFFKLIGKLEAAKLVGDGLTFHGLRHSVGALLKETGASDEDIAIALAHKTTVMARHYSERAKKRGRMKAVVHRMNQLGRDNGRQMDLKLGADDDD